MARECIRQCPRIEKCFKAADSNTTISALGRIPLGYGNIDQLREYCEASYGCPGPVVEPAQVVKGFFKTRIEIENRTLCGLAKAQQHAET